MKEAFEKIKDFLKSKFDYCAEQAGMNLDAECGSEIASYFRERKELYLDRANIYGEVMREIEKVEAEYGNGWIPVDSGKMPKADERVLCLHDDGFIDCGELVGESWCCDMDEYAIDRTCVVAWHPLPEAYRRENE